MASSKTPDTVTLPASPLRDTTMIQAADDRLREEVRLLGGLLGEVILAEGGRELYDRIEGADLVVTAEGFLDAQSFDGKVVGGVAALAAEAGVPVLAVAGQLFDDAGDRIDAISLVERFGPERAVDEAVALIESVVAERLQGLGAAAASG